MDIIPEAIEDAKENAQRMGYTNTHYEAGTAEEIIPRWYKEGYRQMQSLWIHHVQDWGFN